MARHAKLRQAIYGTPWAIEPQKFHEILAFVEQRIDGREFTAQEIRARLGGEPPSARRLQRSGRVAVVPIAGVLAQHMNLITEASGGTAVDTVRRDVHAALADPEIATIVLAIDSPGGSVHGITELAGELRQARQQKPIIAVADPLAASAAYWLAAQATEIVLTPSGYVGSIGILCAHEDRSEQQRQDGIATTVITSAKYKAEGHPYAPLTAEARAELQRKCNEMDARFKADVAAGRGVSVATVDAEYGQGRTLSAAQAGAAGMIDAVASFDEVVHRLHDGTVTTMGASRPRPTLTAGRLVPYHTQLDLAAKRLALLAARYP